MRKLRKVKTDSAEIMQILHGRSRITGLGVNFIFVLCFVLLYKVNSMSNVELELTIQE